MTQYQFNCMQNNKEYWWLLLGSTLSQLMDQIPPKKGDPLVFYLFSMFLMLQHIVVLKQNQFNCMIKKRDRRLVILGGCTTELYFMSVCLS